MTKLSVHDAYIKAAPEPLRALLENFRTLLTRRTLKRELDEKINLLKEASKVNLILNIQN